MSRTVSPSSNKPYGVAQVAAVWDLARSSYYAARHREQHPREPQKRGPKVLSETPASADPRSHMTLTILCTWKRKFGRTGNFS